MFKWIIEIVRLFNPVRQPITTLIALVLCLAATLTATLFVTRGAASGVYMLYRDWRGGPEPPSLPVTQRHKSVVAPEPDSR